MVVLSAALCDNGGRALLSRQFVDIPKGKVEGLLIAFSNFLDPTSDTNYIETENARYLYLPLESMYVLLMTTRNSNIIEDLETLSLIRKIIPEYCESLDLRDIKDNIFNLLLAIDELITSGYKEKLSISQLKQLTDMDSNEEKLHDMIERNKLIETRELAKKKQKEIAQEKKEKRKMLKGRKHNPPPFDLPLTFESDHIYVHEKANESKREEEEKSSAGKSSMKLRKEDNKFSRYLKEMERAGELAAIDNPIAPPSSHSAALIQSIPHNEVHLEIKERICLVMKSDGRLESFLVNGGMSIIITNPDLARLRILYHSPSKSQFQFRGHPHLNKQKVNQNIIELKSPEKSFPLNNPLEVLKWQFQSKDTSDVPLIVSCWPTLSDESYTVNIEYELTATFLELNDVRILIPIPQGHQPVVESNDGTYEFEPKKKTLVWSIPLIDVSNNTGAMEFTIPFTGSPSAFFPIFVDFISTHTFSQIAVDAVLDLNNEEEEVDYSRVISFAPTENEYKIEE